MLFITHVALLHLGRAGLFTVGGIMGLADVDPVVLSLANSAFSVTPVTRPGEAIIIAAVSHNLAERIYAYGFADRRTGLQGLALLAGLALSGVIPLLF